MTPGTAIGTTVTCIHRTTTGIIWGCSTITTAAGLDAITDGTLSHGCLVLCVSSNAVNTVQMMINEGTSTAPVFKAIMSVGGIDPDA